LYARAGSRLPDAVNLEDTPIRVCSDDMSADW
jgi:hypothetical protein